MGLSNSLRLAAVAGSAIAAVMAGPAVAKDTIKLAVPAFLSRALLRVRSVFRPAMAQRWSLTPSTPAAYRRPTTRSVSPVPRSKSTSSTKPAETPNRVAEYRNLVQKREMDVVIGYISSSSCAALARVEELQRLTVFAVCGTPRIFEEAERRYSFRTMAHATADNVATAHYVAENFPEIKSYTGINQNYAWGQDSWRDFNLSMQSFLPSAKASDKLQFPKNLRRSVRFGDFGAIS